MAKKLTANYKKARQSSLLVFIVVFVLVGGYLIYATFASSIAVVKSDADYWRPRIAKCESGGRYNAVNSAGYYGAYQFDVGTWSNFGGFARADLAPPEVQDAKFNEVFARRGSQPWNSSYFCWSRGTAIVTPKPSAPAFIPKLGSYNVTVSGNVAIGGQPAKSVGIFTCGNTPEDFKTDDAGNFAFVISSNKDFCVRVKDKTGLVAINNNFEQSGETSYEYQLAGTSCYKNIWCLFIPAYRWDRSTDANYDFRG